MTTTNKPNTLFWVIAVIIVLWNVMGATAFIFDNFFPETLAETYDPAQLEVIANAPLWSKAIYGVATIGGLIAALLLVARKMSAVKVFLISLIAVIVHTIYNVFFENGIEVFGTFQGLIFPLIIVLLAVFEYWFSKYCAAKGWLS